jgi:plastocyanin
MLTRIILSSLVLAGAAGASASAPAPANIQIVIDQFAFTKPEVRARVGDTIEWINKDIVDHTSTEKKSSAWNVTLATGKSAKVTMKTGGTFDYFCRLHPNMTARLLVAPADSK